MANPLADIRRSPAWAAWPVQWASGVAGGMATRGDKGLMAVVHNVASMQKRLHEGVKERARINDRARPPRTWNAVVNG